MCSLETFFLKIYMEDTNDKCFHSGPLNVRKLFDKRR